MTSRSGTTAVIFARPPPSYLLRQVIADPAPCSGPVYATSRKGSRFHHVAHSGQRFREDTLIYNSGAGSGTSRSRSTSSEAGRKNPPIATRAISPPASIADHFNHFRHHFMGEF